MTVPRDPAASTGQGDESDRAVPGPIDEPEHALYLLPAVLYVLAGVLIVGMVRLVSGLLTLYSLYSALVAGVVVLALPAESARALTRLPGLWLVVLGLGEAVVAHGRRSALRRAAGTRLPGTPGAA